MPKIAGEGASAHVPGRIKRQEALPLHLPQRKASFAASRNTVQSEPRDQAEAPVSHS